GDAERPDVCSHAERGNEAITLVVSRRIVRRRSRRSGVRPLAREATALPGGTWPAGNARRRSARRGRVGRRRAAAARPAGAESRPAARGTATAWTARRRLAGNEAR